MLKISIAQINPTIGDWLGNLALHHDGMRAAADQDADLVVFPELSLCGYYPGDLLEVPEFLAECRNALRSVVRGSLQYPDLFIVLGCPVENVGAGKPLHNALVLIRNGEILQRYFKQLLPTENIFDERRHFEPGPDVVCIEEIRGHRVAFLVCEDSWNGAGTSYPINPLARVKASGVDILVTINASPSNLGKRALRHRLFAEVARFCEAAVVYANQVGGQDSLVFDGASFVLDREGSVRTELRSFQEASSLVTFVDGSVYSLNDRSVGALDLSEFYRRQIVLGIRDYARRCGFSSAVVGCSGGIDSALTLALAVEALGQRNVTAITMPSQHSSDGSVSDSEVLCANLGIELLRHPIKPLVGEFAHGFRQAFSEQLRGIALENVQARIRAVILYEFSNTYGALLLTTGNKSELSVGYSTTGGDAAGGLGPIGDLYKTEIFALCRYLNKSAGREIIPVAIIDKPPSAELSPGQKDTDSLPPYEVLDQILKQMIERRRLDAEEAVASATMVEELITTAEGRATYNRVLKMISRNEYKRRQAPPIIRVRALAFGSGRQMPIAAMHELRS